MARWIRARPGRTYLAGAPMLVAHRGGARLAPENTVEAFTSAVSDWSADMLELDVRVTRDDRLVVIHDDTVDRTTDGVGPVGSLTLKELQVLDAGARFVDLDGQASFAGRGARVPTLDEVLEACPHVWVNVELKESAAAEPFLRVVDRHGAHERVLLAAEHERSRPGTAGYAGPRGASRSHVYPFWLSHRLWRGGPYTPGVDILQLPERWHGVRIVSPRLVREAHRRNIPVQVWTVDDPGDMRRLLSWGVDGIQTDRPDLLAEVLEEVAGRPVAPARREARP